MNLKTHKFSIIFLLISKLLIINASISGLYIDNGYDRTILQREMTVEDKENVEHEILELLGLPDRPMKKHSHLSMRKSAPKFLLDIYQRLTDEENGVQQSRFARSTTEDNGDNSLTDLDKIAIEQSDIIMTFLNKNHHVSEVRHERGRRLWFDVAEVSKENILMMAELRFYQNPLLGKWHNKTKTFTITVYSIIKADGQKELEMLSTMNTTSNYKGWLELNVTDGLSRWLSDKGDNKGLYISAHSTDKPDHEVKLDDIGLVNTKGEDEFQPFMVGFFKGPEIVQSKKHKRIKRNTHNKRKKKSEMKNPLLDSNRLIENLKSCQIQNLYVNFIDLKWHEWIIAPTGYAAYYCAGECHFPLNAHMNATNHAIVQTLVHLMHPSKVPKPCCAPTKLTPISVLYFLDESNINLKKYKNMVVKSCGCH